MITYYNSTCPHWNDTRAIAKGKWLQIQNGQAEPTRSDKSVIYPTQAVTFHDTKLMVLEKILQVECDAPGEVVL